MECGFCGELGHEAWRCRNAPPLNASEVGKGAPVETPGANGVYTGPAKVRTIPQGVSGEELGGGEVRLTNIELGRTRGRGIQHRAALARNGGGSCVVPIPARESWSGGAKRLRPRIYLSGGMWWIEYRAFGKRVRECSNSDNRGIAKALLLRRQKERDRELQAMSSRRSYQRHKAGRDLSGRSSHGAEDSVRPGRPGGSAP